MLDHLLFARTSMQINISSLQCGQYSLKEVSDINPYLNSVVSFGICIFLLHRMHGISPKKLILDHLFSILILLILETNIRAGTAWLGLFLIYIPPGSLDYGWCIQYIYIWSFYISSFVVSLRIGCSYISYCIDYRHKN
jgi:hypothetical protein